MVSLTAASVFSLISPNFYIAASLFYLLTFKSAKFTAIYIIFGSKTSINSDVINFISVLRYFLSRGLPMTDIERYEFFNFLVF